MTEIVLQNKPQVEVLERDGVAVTTSRNIAAVFEKNHKDVMRDIRNIIAANTDADFNLHNFVEVDYTDAKGRTYQEFLLTRDGAMMLIMSYTGPKAMAIKTAYIKRFNEMEQQLMALQGGILQPQQAPKAQPEPAAIPLTESLKAASIVLKAADITGNQLALALDKAYKAKTGESALALTGVQLKAPTNYQLLTPTEIGKQLGIGARVVNGCLSTMGYQVRTAKGWELTDKGRAMGGVYLDVNKRDFNGAPIRQLKWPALVVGRVQDFREQALGINTLLLQKD